MSVHSIHFYTAYRQQSTDEECLTSTHRLVAVSQIIPYVRIEQ